jgi:hypothetical protein
MSCPLDLVENSRDSPRRRSGCSGSYECLMREIAALNGISVCRTVFLIDS